MNPTTLESVLHRLADIGPRPHGSKPNEEALQYAEEMLQRLGMTVVSEDFTAPVPQLRSHTTVSINGATVSSVPFLESVDGRAQGRVDKAPNCLIWGMHDTEVWVVHGPDATAAIAVPPFPSAVQQHIPPELADLPSVLVSQADAAAHHLTAGSTAAVEISSPPRHAPGRCLRAFFGDTDPLSRPEPTPHPLLVAHIDTVPETPGVYDNAAGVAAAISVCAERTRPDFQVLITSGEEEGLAGARAFVQRLQQDGKLAVIELAIVLDGGGRGDVAEAWMSENVDAATITQRFEATAKRRGYQTVTRQPAPPASDHAAFIDRGVPSVMFTVNDLDILHTSKDTYEESKLRGSRLLAHLAESLLDPPDTGSPQHDPSAPERHEP